MHKPARSHAEKEPLTPPGHRVIFMSAEASPQAFCLSPLEHLHGSPRSFFSDLTRPSFRFCSNRWRRQRGGEAIDASMQRGPPSNTRRGSSVTACGRGTTLYYILDFDSTCGTWWDESDEWTLSDPFEPPFQTRFRSVRRGFGGG